MFLLSKQDSFDFLEVYDFLGTHQDVNTVFWNRVIDDFKWRYNPESSKTSGLKYFNKTRARVCSTLSYDFAEDYAPNSYIYDRLSYCIKEYTKKYDYLDKLNQHSQWRLCPSYNVQRYEEGVGYFGLHNESSGARPYRLLAWMIYLNNAKSGTEFPYQNRTVTPQKGRTVIWPAGWTHPHKGVTPNEGVKYIATGWYYTLPKGEPQFDGKHPDEERIQEIVI